jgi:energy-coupling factor transport system substrate-specific component
MKKFGVKESIATGIGTVLFVALTEVQIPIPEAIVSNTAFQIRAALIAFLAAVFGPVVGGVIGFVGHAAGDAIFYGEIWWGWVIADAAFGILVGLGAVKLRINEGHFGRREMLLFNLVQVAANIISWLIIAPIIDILGSSRESAYIREVFEQGALACIANCVIIAVLGTLTAFAYFQKGSKAS